MNTRIVPFTAALAALLAALPLAARAQQAPPAPAPDAASSPALSGQKGRHGGSGRWREQLAALTPEERQRVIVAHRAALHDPAVQAAKAQRATDHRAFRQTLRDAMLRADPTLGPTLDKLRAARHAARADKPGQGKQSRLAALNPDERARLQTAHRFAQNDPAVAAARQQLQSATTKEDRRAAHRAMRDAVRNAMLRSDPSVGTILQKIGKNAPNAGAGAGA